MKICGVCGQETVDEAQYCLYCGNQYSDAPDASIKREPKRRRKNAGRRPVEIEPMEDYDGYYDDVIPKEGKSRRYNSDKSLWKKAVLVGVVAGIIIVMAVLLMGIL